jgi:hypothetical protein
MGRPVDIKSLETRSNQAPKLGPGLHAARLELATERGFRVRTLTGERFAAECDDSVERELIEQCMRSNQFVILTDTDQGPLIVGALQTQRALHREPDGTLRIEAKKLELNAEESLRLQSSASSLELKATGKVRINGHRLLVDVDTNVRVLSALVELP